jgi:MFS family permease
LGFLTIGGALGNAFGALISGPLLDLNGVAGLAGWQWIFLVTGLLPMFAVLLVLWRMKDGPRQADFLTPPERERLITLVDHDARETKTAATIFSALLNLRTLAFGLGYAAILCALYGVIYWSPSIIQSFGVTGTVNGLLVAAPWMVDIGLLLMIPRNLSRRTVLLALIGICAVGVATFALSAFATSVPLRYATLFVGIPCISLTIALFWTFPIRLFQGAQAAATIAAISMIGNFGGFIGQNAMPAVARWGGGASAALLVPCACLGAVLVCSLIALVRGQVREKV